MTRRIRLLPDREGSSSIQFALAFPVLMMMIYGIFQFGRLFEADAGMQHALGEGARLATVCVTPASTGCTVATDTQISAKVTSKLFGAAQGLTPSVTRDTTNRRVTISLTYSQAMSFLFFTGPTVTFTRSKVAYYPS